MTANNLPALLGGAPVFTGKIAIVKPVLPAVETLKWRA